MNRIKFFSGFLLSTKKKIVTSYFFAWAKFYFSPSSDEVPTSVLYVKNALLNQNSAHLAQHYLSDSNKLDAALTSRYDGGQKGVSDTCLSPPPCKQGPFDSWKLRMSYRNQHRSGCSPVLFPELWYQLWYQEMGLYSRCWIFGSW